MDGAPWARSSGTGKLTLPSNENHSYLRGILRWIEWSRIKLDVLFKLRHKLRDGCSFWAGLPPGLASAPLGAPLRGAIDARACLTIAAAHDR